MKKFLFLFIWICAGFACTPTSTDPGEAGDKEEQDYMMDEDSMDKQEKMENDSLKNRDMLAGFIK